MQWSMLAAVTLLRAPVKEKGKKADGGAKGKKKK